MPQTTRTEIPLIEFETTARNIVDTLDIEVLAERSGFKRYEIEPLTTKLPIIKDLVVKSVAITLRLLLESTSLPKSKQQRFIVTENE